METCVIQTFWWWFNVRFYNRVVKYLAEFLKGLGNLKAESIVFVVLSVQVRRARQADLILGVGVARSRASGFLSLGNLPLHNPVCLTYNVKKVAHSLERLLVFQERSKFILSPPNSGEVMCSRKSETKT